MKSVNTLSILVLCCSGFHSSAQLDNYFLIPNYYKNKPLKVITYSYNVHFDSITSKEITTLSKTIEIDSFNLNGDCVYHRRQDSAGQTKIEQTAFDTLGRILSQYISRYEDKDSTIVKTELDSAGAVKKRAVTYKGKGNLISKKEIFNENGYMESKTLYFHNSLDNLSKTLEISHGIDTLITTYKYDSLGRETSFCYDWNPIRNRCQYSDSTFYDDMNGMRESRTYDHGRITNTTLYKYDSLGHTIGKVVTSYHYPFFGYYGEFKTWITEYQFTYDENANWTEKTSFSNGRKYEIKSRVFTYQ